MKGYKHCKNDIERKARRAASLHTYNTSEKGHACVARYHHKIMPILRKLFGGKCQHCGDSKQLEFAHIAPTPICASKAGRHGKRDSSQISKRKDIHAYPHCYKLLCHKCHEQMDLALGIYKGQPGAFRNQVLRGK